MYAAESTGPATPFPPGSAPSSEPFAAWLRAYDDLSNDAAAPAEALRIVLTTACERIANLTTAAALVHDAARTHTLAREGAPGRPGLFEVVLSGLRADDDPHSIVHSGDVGADERWPGLTPAAADDLGLASVLVVELVSTALRGRASLVLTSDTRYAFTDADVFVAVVLASRAARAVTALELADLDPAEQDRVVTTWTLGVAAGRLMTELGADVDQAYTLLRLASQYGSRRLLDVAADVVATGAIALPERARTPPQPLTPS